MVSQAIMLALVGVPGIYFHSLLGSRGRPEGSRSRGAMAPINRQKLVLWKSWSAELEQPGHRRQQVLERYQRLLSGARPSRRSRQRAPRRCCSRPRSLSWCSAGARLTAQLCACTTLEWPGALGAGATNRRGGTRTWLQSPLDGRSFHLQNRSNWKPLGPYGIAWLVPRPAGSVLMPVQI